MKKYLLIFVLPVFLFSCTSQDTKSDTPPPPPPPKEVKDGVFIHVSKGYDNPKKVLMALSLASKFSESHDVALFFDIEGVKLLTHESEDMVMENYMSLKEALNKLISNEVLIMACPMCVKSAGLTDEDLIEGVIIAEKEKFFDFTEGRILSLDY